MRTVLSISGGGVRGLIPAHLLHHLEIQAARPVGELFDLVAGTSVGGVLALALTRPDPVPAANLPGMFLRDGEAIFRRSLWRTVASVGGLADERYGRDGLMAVAQYLLGGAELGDAQPLVMVTSYDIYRRQVLVMKSWRPEWQRLGMREAALASTAAPTYFEPHLAVLPGNNDDGTPCIDGGVVANHPGLCAYAEAQRLWPGEQIYLVSLGTGHLIRPIRYEEARCWGLAAWALPILSILMDGQRQVVDYQLRTLLGPNYLHLDTDLQTASDDLDNASRANLRALEGEAARIINAQGEQIEVALEVLNIRARERARDGAGCMGQGAGKGAA